MKIARKSKAMSLLVTLAFIVIITILVVAFAETVRLSRPAAASYLERSRADQFARFGIEDVIATLNQQTGDSGRYWITRPGQIIVGSLTDDPGTTVDERKVLSGLVSLHSGSAPTATNSDPFYAPVNLNVVTFRDPNSHLLTEQKDSNQPLKMAVKWIYVRKSGVLDTNAQPTISTNDPVVGRYAFWSDDESSKVNYNIAWGRSGNSNPPGHPTQIGLSALTNFTQAQADLVHSFVTGVPTNRPFNFFNTPLDARRIEQVSGGAGLASALRDNKFDVTHFNSDPNTTFFNEPRIVLTTRPDLAGWTTNASGKWVGINGKEWENGGLPRYLRILKDPQVSASGVPLDPGTSYAQAIDADRLSETIATLALRPGTNAAYLQRNDWPMVSGTGSFESKYYGSYPASVTSSGISVRTSRLAQMAVNIIEYVRAKESTNALIPQIIGYFDETQTDPAKAFVVQSNGDPKNGYIGITRGPIITEMGVWYGTNSGAPISPPTASPELASSLIPTGSPYFLFKAELFLPPNYGLDSVDLTKIYFSIQTAGDTNTKWSPNYPSYNSDVHKIVASEVEGGNAVLNAGNYAVITRAVLSTNSPAAPAPARTRASTRFILSQGILNSFYQFAPNGGLTNGLPVSTGAVDNMVSLEVDDPRLNQHPGDWVQVSGNSFGMKNSRWTAGKPAPNIVPEVDTEDGLISDASLYMPPPRGKIFTRSDGTVDDNTQGRVASVGELGVIHTGYEALAKVGATAIPPGVPWRTLRLQPSQSGTNVVPDWALLDLFTAPIAAPNSFNKYVYAPHDTSFAGRINLNSQAIPFGLQRISPIAAALQGASFNSRAMGNKLSVSAAKTLATNIVDRVLATGGKQYGFQAGYDSPGEIVEIKGIADGGEPSEELFRQTANLFTARGAVYSVYTVGQALKQTPTGKLTVAAEQRMQAIVERYADTNGVVHFAPVYLKNLTP